MKAFHCALFLDDNTRIEGRISAESPERALSRLLAQEAARRGLPCIHLLEQVVPHGAVAHELP